MSSDGWKAILILLAVAAVYLVGNARTQLFDRDEPRYAQCSRQMLQSGDWVVPRLYDQIRANKPPGIYWCQATMMELFGDTAFAARMPSVLAALLTAVLLALVLWRPLGPQSTIWALLVFTSSALTIFAAKVCLTDSVLLLWTTISFVCIYLLWRGRGGWPAVLVLSLSVAFGALVKGPFILGVLGSTVVMLSALRLLDRWVEKRGRLQNKSPDEFERSADPSWDAQRRGAAHVGVLTDRAPSRLTTRGPVVLIKVGVAVLIVAAIIGPWVYLVEHRQPHFLVASTQDAVEHLQSGAEGHKGPPGYHLALIWLTFLPWSLLLPLSIVSAFRNRRVPEIRFALAVVLGTWVFVEVLQTKLPHYMLSAFPALAVLTADVIVRCLKGEMRDLESRQMLGGAAIWGLAVAALAIVPWWWIAIQFRDFDWGPLLALAAVGVCCPIAVNLLLRAHRPAQALACMAGGALFLVAILFGLYLPRSRPLRLPVRIAQVLRQNNVIHPDEVKMLDYKEPSLAFYQGGTIREAKHSLATIEHLDSAPPWMVVSRQIWDQTTPDIRARLAVVAQFRGLNYSDALHPVEVLVVRKR